MNILLDMILVWLMLDLFVIGTIWYGVVTLPRLCPRWWRQVVVAKVGREFKL